MKTTFQEKLLRFMYGRYGTDELYSALTFFELGCLVVGAVFSLLGRVSAGFAVVGWVLYALALLAMGWGLFRFLSRNLPARRRENDAWLRSVRRLKSLFRRSPRPSLPPDTDTHVFRACPSCGAVLRLPREPGRHAVKCPRCGKGFGVRVK